MDIVTYAKQSMYRWRNIKGISVNKFLSMWQEQEGKCYICKEEMTLPPTEQSMTRVTVDHNHSTLVLRALLCTSCNMYLGHIEWNLIQLSRNINWSGWANRGSAQEYLAEKKQWVDYLVTFGTIKSI